MARLAVMMGVINLELSEFEVVIKNKKKREKTASSGFTHPSIPGTDRIVIF